MPYPGISIIWMPKPQCGMLRAVLVYFSCDKICRFVIPFEYLGKKLTESQIEKIIFTGKSPLIKGFEGDKKGRITISKENKIELVEG